MRTKYLLTILISISLAGNILFFIADGITYLRINQLQKKNHTNFPCASSLEEFHRCVFERNLDILVSGKRPDIPNFPVNLWERIKYNLNIAQPQYPFFEGGEPNHVLVATLEDAIRRNDTESIKKLEDVFEQRILPVELTEVDCSFSGGAAILFHQYSGDERYKDYADHVLDWLRERETPNGILYRRNNTRFQLNDGYGMYIPFLNLYHKTYNDTLSQQMVNRHMEIAAKYLMDSVSGIPVHGFTLSSSHSKVMSCNFGRGISWFVSGLNDIDTTALSIECKEAINRLDNTLCEIWKTEGRFTQFPGEGGSSDLSAELPILYYLLHKGLISLTEQHVLKYSQMSENGLLYHSSGSVTTSYSALTGPNILSQAFMLRILNELIDE